MKALILATLLLGVEEGLQPEAPRNVTVITIDVSTNQAYLFRDGALIRKSAAAMLLQNRIDHYFDAIVTGASEKGTWVRIFDPPVEGKLVHGFEGMKVGRKLRVKLIMTDAERGFIDFVRA